MNAASTPARCHPYDFALVAGRRSTRTAKSASSSASVSVTLCKASPMSASEFARMPTTISTTTNAAVAIEAIRSFREACAGRVV